MAENPDKKSPRRKGYTSDEEAMFLADVQVRIDAAFTAANVATDPAEKRKLQLAAIALGKVAEKIESNIAAGAEDQEDGAGDSKSSSDAKTISRPRSAKAGSASA
jgi:hypothetical protein